MITSHQAAQRAADDATADDFALLSLRLLWCSDCRSDQLFERPPTVESEWACTDCGAAYVDAIDLEIAVGGGNRGVA